MDKIKTIDVNDTAAIDRAYNNLSESDKAIISSIINMTFALLKNVQMTAEGKGR